KKGETEKHIIYSICEYYDNIGNDAKRVECVGCFNDIYGENEVPSDKLKECVLKLPERFKKCADAGNVYEAFKQEILKWRQEQRVLFATQHKDILSFKELETLSQVASSFFMAHHMVADLPTKQVELVIKPVYKCLEPGIDMTQFDNEVMNEQDVENELKNDEATMLKKGSNVVKRQATEEDVSIRTRVKNMYRRLFRYYVCSINRIGEDKEASSIVKEFMQKYEGIVPAKVARDACKW
uniref:Uncharacterized protein n=1 Tax=Strigamia maritima TaxID=126957 RepID=T1JBD3_STRMM